jgi:alkanesulfonate monooxygenase
VLDSLWHKQLSEMAEQTKKEKSPYWLRSFENYSTSFPYLVGSYHAVAQELARYIALGYRLFILDVLPSQEELHHINVVFAQASQEQYVPGLA